MKRSMFVAVLLVAVAGAVSAGIVLAQLGDTQTASGTINATTASADLYICEPDSTPGPACGSDDNGADEAVFESLEDIRPGDTVRWDIRLQNVGTEPWATSDARLTVESLSPGVCPDSGLVGVGGSNSSLFILGKSGDPINDNLSSGLPGLQEFRVWEGNSSLIIKVAPGDYEDVTLAIRMSGAGVDGCDGNEWNVSWELGVVPVAP